MNPSSPTLPPVTPIDQPAKQRPRWPSRLAIGAAVVVALVAGAGIGAAGTSKQPQLNAANAKIAADGTKITTLQDQKAALQSQAVTLQAQYNSAKSAAQNALSVAEAKVRAADGARQAQLNQEAATLKRQQAQLNAETGMVQSNQISQDGVYVIGRDMKGGLWHTSGGSQCYYAKLASTDTSNIIDNNNFSGPDTVDMSGGYAFEISGGCTWVKIG